MRKIAVLLLCQLALLFVLSLSSVFAQVAPGNIADANHPAGAPDPQKSADVWQVDPISDQVSIRIPFTTTPTGGPGPKLPFVLLYNSGGTVTLQASGSVPLGAGTGSVFTWSPQPLAWAGSLVAPSGPWTTSGPYFYSQFSNIPDQGFTDTNGAYHITGYGCIITGPYTYVDAEGSAHGLELESFTSNYTSGWNGQCALAQSHYTQFWPSSKTADGSGLLSANNSATGPDGTIASGHQLQDAYGNIASLSTTNGVTTATDAIGRTVYVTNIPIGKPGQIPAGQWPEPRFPHRTEYDFRIQEGAGRCRGASTPKRR